jgi:hypothetical protein
MLRTAVRAFHVGNTGSNPVGDANIPKKIGRFVASGLYSIQFGPQQRAIFFGRERSEPSRVPVSASDLCGALRDSSHAVLSPAVVDLGFERLPYLAAFVFYFTRQFSCLGWGRARRAL